MLTTFAARASIAWALLLLSHGSGHAQEEFELDASPAQAETLSAEATALPEPRPRNPLEVSREHMERGQALYGAGRYIESAEEFLRAYEAQPFSAFLYNAGVAYEKVGDPARAADYFTRFLQTEPGADHAAKLSARIERLGGLARARDAELAAADAAAASSSAATLAELENARRRLAELQAQLGALSGRADFKSLLSVQTTPPDATVWVKTQAGEVLFRGTGPKLTQTLDPGSYVVEVQHPKYTTIAAPITVAAAVVNVVLAEMSQGQFLGLLRVQSDIPGAAVYVDERDVGALGRTPFQLPVKVGRHHVWIERPGYQPVQRDVEVGVGDDSRLVVALQRVNYGRIRVVASRADADVAIDGKRLGRVPAESNVSAGRHVVVVSAPGMKSLTTKVVVQRGQVTPLRVRLRPQVGRKGAWATAGVAAAFLGASIATGAVGYHLQHELSADRRARTLESDDERIKRGKYLYIGSDVGYGITAGLLGFATYYFLRDPLPDSEGRTLESRDWTARIELSPELAPGRAGGQLHVSF
ncbi:MAG: TonB-dependent receptor [Myxococcaceae bacterium]|nr:TonB-dependent receptor [Myxococcaceae bacterium]